MAAFFCIITKLRYNALMAGEKKLLTIDAAEEQLTKIMNRLDGVLWQTIKQDSDLPDQMIDNNEFNQITDEEYKFLQKIFGKKFLDPSGEGGKEGFLALSELAPAKGEDSKISKKALLDEVRNTLTEVKKAFQRDAEGAIKPDELWMSSRKFIEKQQAQEEKKDR